MRHVALTTVAAFAAVVAIVACEEQAPNRSLTAPDGVSFAKPIGGACDAGRARLIETQQGDLWARPALDSAKARFALVSAVCGTTADKRRMLDYIQWTIANRGSVKSTAPLALFLTHWKTVFPYVDYTGDDAPNNVPDSIFLKGGAAKVIHWDVEDSLNATNAALTSRAQNVNGDQRDHLFVIYPIAAGCLTGTNLQQLGPCFEFASFPHVSPKFDPRIKTGICVTHDPSDSVEVELNSPALAHLDSVTRVTDSTQRYPGYCTDTEVVDAGSWNNGFGGMVKRLAWLAKKAVTPQTAYAVHGGLGGLGPGLSPHGAVDREIFLSTFTDDAVGLPPGNGETGTWTQQIKPPGSILVQSSLGQHNQKLVVLNQSGGNCAKCFGLLLQGNLFSAGSAASSGIYDVEWISLQDAANMKEAVFVLRDSGGRDIARVTYAVRNNTKLILYNDVKNATGLTIANWVQHVPAHFRIRVDLDANTTTLYFNGNAVSGASGVAFVNTSAANLATVSADFRGIDSGIMGWDEIQIERLPDINH